MVEEVVCAEVLNEVGDDERQRRRGDEPSSLVRQADAMLADGDSGDDADERTTDRRIKSVLAVATVVAVIVFLIGAVVLLHLILLCIYQ